MDDLDLKIIAACNDLMRMKAENARTRVDHINERDRLNRGLEKSREAWEIRLKEHRSKKGADLAVYQEACHETFSEDDIYVPAFAAARQAQLCLHIHLMTVEEQQLHRLNDECREMIMFLQNTLGKIREEQAEIEIEMLNQIVQLQIELAEVEALKKSDISIENMPSGGDTPKSVDKEGVERSESADNSHLTQSTFGESDSEDSYESAKDDDIVGDALAVLESG